MELHHNPPSKKNKNKSKHVFETDGLKRGCIFMNLNNIKEKKKV